MRARLLFFTIMLVALAAAGGVARADTAGKVKLAATVATCTTGADDASRAAAFTGSMPATATTRRMQMRFQLLQRTGSGAKAPFRKVAVPGWNAWATSDAGRGALVFTKRVEGLAAPASYRATVTFRWLDAHGRTLRTTTRTTATCDQPDPRADLVLASLDGTSLGSSSAQAIYTVAVENAGHADADPFAVTVTVGDTVSQPVTLGPIAAGAQATGTLTAPRCAPGSTITVTLDVADTVEESDEADDVVVKPCPLA